MKFSNIKSKLFKDLRLQLLALYLIFGLPLIIGALVFDLFAGDKLRNEVMSSDLALARAIAQETDTFLTNGLTAVENLSSYPGVINIDKDELEILFSQIYDVRPDVNLIYRLDENGTMVYHYPEGPGSTLGVDFSYREYFSRSQTTHSPLMSLGRISPTTEEPVSTAVMPLWSPQGEYLGLVATNIRLQSFSDTLNSIAAEYPFDDFGIYIVDAAGNVIAHPETADLLKDFYLIDPILADQALNGFEGNIIQENPQGIENLYSITRIPITDWSVIVSRPTQVAFATPLSIHNAVLLTVLIFVAIGILFWLTLSNRVINPLEILHDYSQAIASDAQPFPDLIDDVRTVANRKDQVGKLVHSFTKMEKDVNQRFTELATLLQTSAAVVSTLDHQDVLDRILEQIELLLGKETCAIVALDSERQVFKAKASRGLSKRYSEHLVISPDEHFSATLRSIRTGQPIIISDTETDPSFTSLRPRARAEGYRSLAAIPLKTNIAPPSALLIYGQKPHNFSKREINLLVNFANHAAMAIENAELYRRSDENLERQTRRLVSLIHSLDDGLILEDLSGKIIHINRSACELVGITENDVINTPITRYFEELLKKRNSDDITLDLIKKSLLSASTDQIIEIDIYVQGMKRIIRINGFNVSNASNRIIGQGQILRDITQDYELDIMRSSLISTASHELRTPLAAIKGYASTLLAEDVDWDSTSQKEFLEIISNEADRLSNLVNNVLDLSHIDAGNLTLSKKLHKIDDLIKNGISRTYSDQEDQIKINLDDGLPAVYVDSQRIEAVIRNLVENAIKYSGNPAVVEISSAQKNSSVIVKVEDNGPGIPEQQQEIVFNSFYRLENELNRRVQGAGLGLAICKGFIKAHGGEIWVEPKENGTCIAFSIPLTDFKTMIISKI